MIGIADPKLWNLGVGLLSKWSGSYFFYIFSYIYIFFNIVFKSHQHILFFCFMPRTPSSARLGQNSRASTSISSIAKMRSSSCH